MATPPTLRNVHSTIRYTASDGYSHECRNGNRYAPRGRPPEVVLLDAFEEIARVVALFELTDRADKIYADVKVRVAARLTQYKAS